MILSKEEETRLLKLVVDHYEQEDRSVRERQIRQWRQLKLAWSGFSKIWYSEVAHDWRIWQSDGDDDQAYYDKPVNIFRAYLESIIAALSITIPSIICYPDDADNSLDLVTAKAGNKIAQLIGRHNNISLTWLHALFLYCTEGMVACYSYAKEDKKYGTYEEREYKDEVEERNSLNCPMCGQELNEQETGNEMQSCPNCQELMTPEIKTESFTVTKLVGITEKAKSRICIEPYGGLYVKVPCYAKKQEDCPYLIFSYETHYALARAQYPDIRNKINPGQTSGNETYERWGRISNQYYGEYPINNVTCRNAWLRPAAFEILDEEQCKYFKEKFPLGPRVVFVNDELAEVENESLDDHWTLTHNPLADFIHFDPLGLLITSLQDITEDLISLILQTIEHGIPQTFADPNVLNFKAYKETEVSPGMIFPAQPKSGKPIGDAFYEVRTATLSTEVLPFFQQVQTLAQLVSGALPSLFGGALGESKTASEYSMSRAQALQRLRNTWQIFNIWWKEIFGKVIPLYIKLIKEDERYVEKDKNGNFINIFIRKAELEGKIGNIELESGENLPSTWLQIRDVVLQLMQANNPQILQLIATPENLPYLYQIIGLTDLTIPGEDDREAEHDEIKELLNSVPLVIPNSPEQELLTGQPEQELPSIEIDPIMDNHSIRFEVDRMWAVSEAGRQAKLDNPEGYKNVLLHAQMHYMQIQQQMLSQQATRPNEKPKETDQEAPIVGEKNVPVQQ